MANGDAHFDIHQRAELGVPQSLPDFQRLFPDAADAFSDKMTCILSAIAKNYAWLE